MSIHYSWLALVFGQPRLKVMITAKAYGCIKISHIFAIKFVQNETLYYNGVGCTQNSQIWDKICPRTVAIVQRVCYYNHVGRKIS